MRALLHSNAPFSMSGYGNQIALIAPRLQALGHDIAISAYFGLETGQIDWHGIPIYPRGFDAFGNDIAAAHGEHFGADILITLQDAFVQKPHQLTARGTRWLSYFPIDSEPLPELIRRVVAESYQPIVMSRFGERIARDAGLDVRYIPHCVDAQAFTPDDSPAARERLNELRFLTFQGGTHALARGLWPTDAFVVGMVANNRGYPSRKALPEQIDAFALLHKQHPDTRLYLHTWSGADGEPETMDLVAKATHAGILDACVFADPYRLNTGYTTAQMRDVYTAMDVLSSVSMGEGFCIPLIEAQACGTRVVIGDWSSMSELIFDGWAVPKAESVPFWTPLDTEWRLPRREAIAEQLAYAYEWGGERSEQARQGVRVYDAAHVMTAYWQPFLAELAERIGGECVRPHTHTWSGTGMENGGDLCVPCTVKDCPAELRIAPGGSETVRPNGFALTVDGTALDIEDDPNGGVAKLVAREIISTYHLDELTFAPGGVVLDIGAHVGVVSIYLAKRCPDLRIFAFEPAPENYARLVRNLAVNDVHNVTAVNAAVTSDGRALPLNGTPHLNSGGMSAYVRGGEAALTTRSLTLADIFETYDIGTVRLLKIDCEGCEYEVLRGAGELLGAVQALRGEFHENARLRAEWGVPDALVLYCACFIPDVCVSPCVIAE